MDLQMPVLDGLQTVRLLRAQYPQVRFIIISMHDEPELIDSLRAEGAHGYLLKNASPEEVLRRHSARHHHQARAAPGPAPCFRFRFDRFLLS